MGKTASAISICGTCIDRHHPRVDEFWSWLGDMLGGKLTIDDIRRVVVMPASKALGRQQVRITYYRTHADGRKVIDDDGDVAVGLFVLDPCPAIGVWPKADVKGGHLC